MRLNARVTEQELRLVDRLCEETGQTRSEVLREAIRRYHDAAFRPRGSALEILQAVGFIGCANGPRNLSSTYKDALTKSLERKHGHR